mgnify:FL=1|tara:strand:+ start:356 stop:628 length:273 start_codon:yes stop_codon:yes gene_type:complete
MSTRYTKAPVPSTPEELPSYLQAELDKLATVISNIADGHMDVINVAPDKPREGDIRYADGTNWNPGHGKGLYYYEYHSNGSHWHHISHTN